MCRVYRTKRGSYIRLCYRFGPRRGERVYFEGEPPLRPSGHYDNPNPVRRPGGRTSQRRCLICGSRNVSRHDYLCGICKAKKAMT